MPALPQPRRSLPCDLCAGTTFDTIATLDRHGDALETVICRTCGLVSHAHVPTEEELAAFYAREYRVAYHGERTPSPRRVVRAWENGSRILRDVAPLLQPGDRVFEIGAGIGCTVKQFELAGFDASGIEPNDGFQWFSQTQLRARVEHAAIEDVPLVEQFDCVLLVHVIEHFGSPRGALERMHGMLRDGGLLHVECPNLEGPFATRARLFHEAHTYNFTASSLVMLARSIGFEPVRQFVPRHDPSLQIAFRKTAPRPLLIDEHNRAATLAALERAEPIRYFARPSYYATRLRKLAGYLSGHLFARRQCAAILRRCAAAGPLRTAAVRAA